MFTTTWKSKCNWGSPPSLSWQGRGVNNLLCNSASLLAAGRSPVVDYWDNRATPNHQVVQRETGDIQQAPSHVATFYVMAARGEAGVAPAQQLITRDFSRTLVDMITAEGRDLEVGLTTAEVVKGEPYTAEWSAQRPILHKFFVQHAAAIEAHMAEHYWPLSHRDTRVVDKVMLCTCEELGLHAECEHIVVVLALTGCGLDLHELPAQRKRGRPIKDASFPSKGRKL